MNRLSGPPAKLAWWLCFHCSNVEESRPSTGSLKGDHKDPDQVRNRGASVHRRSESLLEPDADPLDFPSKLLQSLPCVESKRSSDKRLVRSCSAEKGREMKTEIKGIVGKTIESVIVSANNKGGPQNQIFLVFTDGS